MSVGSFRKRPKSASPESSSPNSAKEPSFSGGYELADTVSSLQPDRADQELVPCQAQQKPLTLLSEIDINREIARFHSGNKLVPLQTHVWDTSQSIISALSPIVRSDLQSVYADIDLLNQLVWLSSEFHRSSRELVSQYVYLSLEIANKLDEITERHGSELAGR